MSLSWTVYLDPTRAAGTSLITAAGRPARMQQWVAGDTISLRIALMDVTQSTPVLIDFDGSTVTVSGIQRSGGDMLFLGTLDVDESGAIGTVSLNTRPLADLLPNGSGKSAVVTAEVTWVGADGPQSVQWPVEILAQVTDSETVPEPLGEWPAAADVAEALATTIPSKMDKTPGAAGDLLDTDAQGNARRSGVTTAAVSTALSTTIPAKMDKAPGAAGDLLDTDAQGNARRSGLTTAAVAAGINALELKLDRLGPPLGAGMVVGTDGLGGIVETEIDVAALWTIPEGFDSSWMDKLIAINGDGRQHNTGISYTDVWTAIYTTLPSKMDKKPGAAGAILDTDGEGNARRSGLTTSAVSTAIAQAGGAVRHDTAMSLGAVAKAQVCSNIGLSAPVAKIEPHVAIVGGTTATIIMGTGGSYYATTNSTTGIRLRFRPYAQFVGAITSATMAYFIYPTETAPDTLSVDSNGTSIYSVNMTRSGGTTSINGVAVADSGTLKVTTTGGTGSWVTNIYINDVLVAQSTGLATRPDSVTLSSATTGGRGGLFYHAHIHTWS